MLEISKVVSEYASKRTVATHGGDNESKAELKALREAHQKRLLRTFDSNSLERQYSSLSSEQPVNAEASRIAHGVR